MLESKHAGYGTTECYPDGTQAELRKDLLERIIRAFLAICFIGVLGLELWLLISALAIS